MKTQKKKATKQKKTFSYKEQKKTFAYPDDLLDICDETVSAMANFFGKFCEEVITIKYDEEKKKFEDIEQEIIFNTALQFLHAVIDACPSKAEMVDMAIRNLDIQREDIRKLNTKKETN